MADGSGRKVAFGIAKETVRGTAQSAATFYLQQLDADFFNKSEEIFNDSVIGVLNVNSASEIVKDYAEGTIGGKVLDKQFGLLLLAALGTVNTVANADASGNVKDHTFTQSQSNTPQSLTVFRKDANSDKAFALAMLRSLEITVVVGEFVRYTADFISKKGTTSTTTVAYALENEFKAKHAVIKMASNTAGLSGATPIPVKSFKIKIERDVNPYYVVGSNDPAEIFVEQFKTSGEMVLRYTDQTYENFHFNNTIQAFSLTLTNSDVTIGTSANPKLVLTLPTVTTNEFKLDQKKENIVEQTVMFTGLYNIGSTAEITAVLTNLQTSY